MSKSKKGVFEKFGKNKIWPIFLILLLALGLLYFKKDKVIEKTASPLSPTPLPVLNKGNTNLQIIGIQGEKKTADDVSVEFDPVIGKKDAPLTFVYWYDYQCPLCRYFEERIFPELIEKYVKTGKMKVVFKDFQFLGQDSIESGWIGGSVWALYPDYYLEFHKKMYEKQDGKNTGFGNYKSVVEMIRNEFKGKMDANKIDRYIQKNKAKLQKEQDNDKSEGILYGIVSTPGFVIGSQRLNGVQPKEVFEEIIQAELDKVLSGKKGR